MFLEQPVPDPVLAPIRGQACWPFLVEYANSLLDPGRNLELGRLKCLLEVVSPHELGEGLQEGSEWCHDWCHGEGKCHLVDQPEPGSDVRDPVGGGELGYGSQVLVAWLDFCVGNLEPSKLHLVLCEAEFVGDPVTGADVQPLCGLVEGVFDGGGP